MADLEVTVGVPTAEAEEGLRRLSATFHREIRSMDRAKAEAKVGADITKLDDKIAKAKRKLLELEKLEADPNVDLDTKQFDAEVAAVKMRLKELGQRKIEIAVDANKLKDANRLAALSSKRQEAMAKQTEKIDRLNERAAAKAHRLAAERERDLINLGKLQSRAIKDDDRRSEAMVRQQAEVSKLRALYNKLANDAAYLEQKTGRPGGIFHTEKERLGLAKLRDEMRLTEHRILSLGGTVDDINPDLEENESIVRRWGESLASTRLHLGFFSASLRQASIGLVALGPIITGLIGSGTSLIGVLGTGIAGASAVGAAGLGGFIAAAVGVSSAIKPAISDISLAIKAAEAYHKAVLKYGKGDSHVEEAQEHLANTLKEISPRAREAVMELSSVKEEWRELTKPVRHIVFDSFAESVKTAKALMPKFADESVGTVKVVSVAWDRWMRKLRSDAAENGLSEIMGNFRESLPPVLTGLETLGEILGRITVSASKELPEIGKGFRTWADDLDHGVDRGQALDEDVERLVGHMKDLGHLAQATGRVLVALFNTSADSGDDMVKTLTNLLNGWADWMNTVEGQESLKKFFAEANDETRELFRVLGRFIALIFKLGRATAPVSAGFLAVLNVVGDVVEAASEFDPLLNVLKEIGGILAVIWGVNKITELTTAIHGAYKALTAYAAAEGAAAAGAESLAAAEGAAATAAEGATVAEGAAAGSAVGGAGAGAGAGLAAGGALSKKIAGGVRKAGLAAGAAFAGGFLAESGAKIIEGFSGGQILEKGHNVWEQAFGSFNTDDVAATEKRALDSIKRQEQVTKRIQANQRLLKSGALASLADIGKITRETSEVIAKNLPRGSEEARHKLAENFRSAADSVKKAMENGTISVRDGTKRMRELLHNAKLVEGNDPLGIAKGFAASWKEAGGINRKQRDRMIDDLKKMPPRAREQAYQAMLKYGRGLVQGKKIPEEDLRLFKSKALTELSGIGGGFNSLSGITYDALKAIGDNLSEMLKNIGGKPPKFNLKKALNMLPELEPLPSAGGKQQGGFTVPGAGSGDKVLRVLPEGAFVMNREASSVYGFNRGGAVVTALEPKEHVFMPHEVAQIGPQNLLAMNAAVPRQKGGPVGKMGGGLASEPQIIGPTGSLLEIGKGAVHQAYAAAETFFKKQQAKLAPKGGAGYTGPAFGPAGTSMYKGVLMATWVRQALEYAAAHGSGDPQPTSGYRSHAQNVSEGRNYFSEHEKTQYPGGAVDFGGMVDPASLPLKMAVVNATRGFKYPLLAPIGFRDDGHASGTGHMLGGFVRAMLATGGFAGSGYTVKGVPASGQQLHTAAEIQEAGDDTGANHLARVASMMAATQESNMGSTGNTFQLTSTFEGVSPSDNAYKQAVQWFTKGYYTGPKLGAGGGIEKSHKTNNPGLIAQEVEGSAYPGLYAQWKSEGQKWTDGWTHSGGATGAAGGKASGPPPIPKTVKVNYTDYRVTPGGDFVAVQHKDEPVTVEIPDFGPLPEGEENIKRELRKDEKELLPMYRAALRQTKRKEVKAKLKESLAKIEKRIRELRAKLRDVRAAKARKHFTKKLQRQLARITGNEPLIEAAQHDYEERNQYAEQTVGFEPEQRGEITHDWLEKEFEPYIEGVERPAYEAVLGAENKWRNQILGGEEEARQIEKWWETQIGWPQDGRKPWLENPDLHFPPRPKDGSPTGLADWIYKLSDSVANIRAFANSHAPAWWASHPNAKAKRDRELEAIKTYYEPAIEKAKFERKGLTSSLGEGRESFDWARGTGSFEDSLQEVQGIHWPNQHEKLESLPAEPVAGMFGGAIWETQETIRDLGIKIREAKGQLEEGGASGSESDKAAEIASFEEAIRGLLAGRPFLIDTHRGPQPYMGAYASGGVALVGERGPELAHMPSGTFIHNAEDTARLLEPSVVVDFSKLAYGPLAGLQQRSTDDSRPGIVNNVTNNFAAPPPDAHTWARQNEFELKALA